MSVKSKRELVMAGLVPANHVFLLTFEDVDARDKRGHDESIAYIVR